MEVTVENEKSRSIVRTIRALSQEQSRYRASGTPLTGSFQKRTGKKSRRYLLNVTESAESLALSAL